MSLYNVAIIGDGVPGARAELERQLIVEFETLGIEPAFLRFWQPEEVAAIPLDAPAVAAFICPSGEVADIIAATQLDALGIPVIPAVADLANFSRERPDILAGYNGLAIGADLSGLARLKSAMLEWLGLLRRQRRLFLSYRRDQSREAALQMYEKLQGAGFDVFLDTHGIRPGDDFQAVLMHRLTDSEIVVLLDTPGFLEKRWTVEELARANLLGIGILQVVWPGHDPPRKSPLSWKRQLTAPEVLGSTGPLVDRVADELINLVEDLRARALATRSAALAGEFREQARRAGAHVAPQPNRTLKAEWSDGRTVIALPTVGIPAADMYHEVYESAQAQGAEPPWLIYDSTGVLARWLDHLDWLDSHLPIRTLKVEDVYRRLRPT